MTELDPAAIADAVVARLGGSVISSALPAHVGAMIRRAAQGGNRIQTNQIYLRGPDYLITDWWMEADGTLRLEMRGRDGSFVWRGVFRPEPAPAP
jgi:hypothetical protein